MYYTGQKFHRSSPIPQGEMGGRKRSKAMNWNRVWPTVKYILALILASGFFLSMSMYWAHVAHSQTLKFDQWRTLIFFGLLLGGIFSFFLAERYRRFVDWLPQEPDRRPIVRVWTHNGITRVCAEADWQICQSRRERELIAYGEARPIRPHPHILIVFWDSEQDFPVPTGNMFSYQNLVSGCRVERTEMYVPKIDEDFSRLGCWPLPFDSAWRMVYGKPPAKD